MSSKMYPKTCSKMHPKMHTKTCSKTCDNNLSSPQGSSLFAPGPRGIVGPAGPVGPQGPIGLSSPSCTSMLYTDETTGSKGDIVEVVYDNNILSVKKINNYKIGVWDWVALIVGGNGNSVVATDCLDNSYVLGTYDTTCIFYNANGSTAFTLVSPIVANGYVGKLDKSGKWLWVTTIRTIDLPVIGVDLKTDCNDNINISIDTQSSQIVFLNSSGSSNLTLNITSNSTPNFSSVIAKMNSDGKWLWASYVHRLDNYAHTSYINTDCDGNLIVTGVYNGAVDFYSHANTIQLSITSSQADDIFAAKLDMNGDWIWTTTISGQYNGLSAHTVIDCDGNYYIVGGCDDNTTDFFNADGSLSAVIYGPGIYIGKLSPNGFWIWTAYLGGDGGEYANGVTVSNCGELYVVGQYGNALGFINSNGTSTVWLASPPNSNDGIVAKIDVNGFWQWAVTLSWQAGGFIDVKDVITDSKENIYIVGSYGNQITLNNSDTSVGIVLTDAPNAGRSIIAKLSPSGFWEYVAKIEGGVYSTSIDIDSHSNIYTAGSYTINPVTLYNTDGLVGLQKSGFVAGNYVARLRSTIINIIGFLKETVEPGNVGTVCFPGGVILENSFNDLIQGYYYYADCHCRLSTCYKCNIQFLGLALTPNKLLTGVEM